VDAAVGDDDELGHVDGVGALAQDAPLRAALAACFEERADVLVVGSAGVRRERLHRRQRLAVAREDVSDAPLRDGHQRGDVYPVLERHQVMHAAAEELGQEARFAVERDEARADGAARAPSLFDDADAIVRDDAKAGEGDEREQRKHAPRGQDDQMVTQPSCG
jgi:hypothetical protein